MTARDIPGFILIHMRRRDRPFLGWLISYKILRQLGWYLTAEIFICCHTALEKDFQQKLEIGGKVGRLIG